MNNKLIQLKKRKATLRTQVLNTKLRARKAWQKFAAARRLATALENKTARILSPTPAQRAKLSRAKYREDVAWSEHRVIAARLGLLRAELARIPTKMREAKQ